MASTLNASNSGAGGLISTADASGVLQLQSAGTTAVTIDTSQNVGIGTTSPSTQLHVSGTNAVLNITRSTKNFYLNPNYANGGSYATFESDLALATVVNGSERMRIDSSGNVLVGKTSQITDELFGVDQTASSRPAIIARAATTGSPSFKSVKVTNVNNTTQYHMTFAYNNGANGNGAIVGNGDSQAAFASFSDSRLKKNIEDLPSQLDKINALRPVEFDYIKSGEHQIGFIAQEVREVYPDLVAEGEDTMLTVTGLGKTEARLIKAIQEQQTIINDLKARVTALEAK